MYRPTDVGERTAIRTNRPKKGQKDGEVEELTEEEKYERKKLQKQKRQRK